MAEPDAKRVRHPRMCVRQTTRKSPLHILHLNNDCLLHILTFLDIDNTVNFVQTCTRIYDLYFLCRPRILKVNCGNNSGMKRELWSLFGNKQFTKYPLPRFIVMQEDFGRYVRTISLKSSSGEQHKAKTMAYVNVIQEKCKQIKCLKLMWNYKIEELDSLFQGMQNLHKLKMQTTTIKPKFFQLPFHGLRRCYIECIADAGELHCSTVALPMVERMSLSYFYLQDFYRLGSACPTLRSLTLANCLYRGMPAPMPLENLVTVRLVLMDGGCYVKFDMSAMSHLRALRNVYVRGNNVYMDEFLVEMCSRDQLRMLRLMEVELFEDTVRLFGQVKNMHSLFLLNMVLDNIELLFDNSFKWVVIVPFDFDHNTFRTFLMRSPLLHFFYFECKKALRLSCVRHLAHPNLNTANLSIRRVRRNSPTRAFCNYNKMESVDTFMN